MEINIIRPTIAMTQYLKIGVSHRIRCVGKHRSPHHKGTTSLVLVSEIATTDSEEASDDVRRDGKKLSTLVGETHVLDNGGEELKGTNLVSSYDREGPNLQGRLSRDQCKYRWW